MHALFEKLKKLQLAAGDYAVFGSGPLLVRNIIDDVNDIDVICRGRAWQQAQQLGELVYLQDYDLHIVSLDNGRLTLGCRWGIGDLDVNELIDGAEIIDGLPFVRLRYVIEYKCIAARPKDLRHLELLRAANNASPSPKHG